MDELFEALTLIQTGKVKYFPVILFGLEYWKGLAGWLRDRVAGEGKIAVKDLDLLHITDSPREAVEIVRRARERRSQALAVPPDETGRGRGGGTMSRKDFLRGPRIDPKPVTGRETVADLVDSAFLAYNAGRLAEACRLYAELMLEDDVTVGMS